jgi:hypothetical protein
MAADPRSIRASGSTQTSEVVEQEAKRIEEEGATTEPLVDVSPRSIFRTPGFHRMKVAWTGDDATTVARVQQSVDDRVQVRFRDAYQLMHDILMVVREPVVDPGTGEIIKDRFGFPEWERTVSGGWVEDWSRLNRKEKENFLFAITTRMWAWELAAADAWGEAMFAKAQWEERFAIAYNAPMSGTIDDRTAHARIDAAEERYFGIMLTLYSRKAEGILRTMTLLAQRLKDTLDLG